MLDVFGLTSGLGALLFLVQLVLKVFAFGDALARKPNAFVAADKQTKKFWLIILGLALLADLIAGRSAFGLLTVIGTVAALVYVVDARPAVAAIGRGGGRGGSIGPYGPW